MRWCSSGPCGRLSFLSMAEQDTGSVRDAESTQRVAAGRVRLGAVAAMAGGVAWFVKGTAILMTADQPPVAFGIGPPLFALGLLGFYAGLGAADARAKRGAVAATLAFGLMVVFGIADAVAPSLSPKGEEFTVLSAVMVAAALCLLAALVLLGLAGRRAQGRHWTALPLWMGVLAVPGFLVGGLLSALNERLLEIPLVLFAIGWMSLGYAMWRSSTSPRTTPL